MAITDQLVQLMGGEIVVDTAPGQGTDFTVLLNLPVAADQTVKPKHAAASSTSAESASLQGRHFLMAEDNEINAEIAESMLEMAGATLDIAHDGAQAVAMFDGQAPQTYDAILMDIQMPVMNGYEAARALRACSSARSEEVKIVALTANAFAEDVKSALDAGMDAHVAKPVDIDGLACVLGKVCG